MQQFTKKYQVWKNYGCEGWSFDEYDTLEECFAHPSNTYDTRITKRVEFEITEKEDE